MQIPLTRAAHRNSLCRKHPHAWSIGQGLRLPLSWNNVWARLVQQETKILKSRFFFLIINKISANSSARWRDIVLISWPPGTQLFGQSGTAIWTVHPNGWQDREDSCLPCTLWNGVSSPTMQEAQREGGAVQSVIRAWKLLVAGPFLALYSFGQLQTASEENTAIVWYGRTLGGWKQL